MAARQLIGVLHEGEIKFPAYQFETASARKAIPALLSIAERNGVPPRDIAIWMITRSSLLAAQDRPVDHFGEPDRLLAAAQVEFGAVW